MAIVNASTGTYLANLIDPEVLAGMVNQKLTDAIRFSPLCRIDNTLSGRPGSTVTLPTYAYIGDAAIVAEGADIPIKQLTASTKEVAIKKIGIGMELTDEALLSGYGSPLDEAVRQIRLSIANAVDNEVLSILAGIPANKTHTTATAAKLSVGDIADALVKFGEDIEGDKALLLNPADYNILRKASDWCPASEISAQLIIQGAVGMVHGCQVVISNKLTVPNTSYIVKPGALALYMKRDILLEADRNIGNKSIKLTADKHYAAYLYDESKAVKLVKKA